MCYSDVVDRLYYQDDDVVIKGTGTTKRIGWEGMMISLHLFSGAVRYRRCSTVVWADDDNDNDDNNDDDEEEDLDLLMALMTTSSLPSNVATSIPLTWLTMTPNILVQHEFTLLPKSLSPSPSPSTDAQTTHAPSETMMMTLPKSNTALTRTSKTTTATIMTGR